MLKIACPYLLLTWQKRFSPSFRHFVFGVHLLSLPVYETQNIITTEPNKQLQSGFLYVTPYSIFFALIKKISVLPCVIPDLKLLSKTSSVKTKIFYLKYFVIVYFLAKLSQAWFMQFLYGDWENWNSTARETSSCYKFLAALLPSSYSFFCYFHQTNDSKTCSRMTTSLGD